MEAAVKETHSKMLATRRRKARLRKEAARIAKLQKKQARQKQKAAPKPAA